MSVRVLIVKTNILLSFDLLLSVTFPYLFVNDWYMFLSVICTFISAIVFLRIGMLVHRSINYFLRMVSLLGMQVYLFRFRIYLIVGCNDLLDDFSDILFVS